LRPVRPTGPTNQPLLALVGEAPGKEEERAGRPFIGKSGDLLNRMLLATGIERDNCYITNVSNLRPAFNNFDEFYTDGAKRTLPTTQLTEHRQRLLKEIIAVRPQVVVALGKEALKALAQTSDLANYRGTMIERKIGDFFMRLIPTYHPAYLLPGRGGYKERPVIEADLKKAIHQARHPYTPKTEFWITPTLDDVLDFINQRHSPVAFDIETIGPHTRSLGFAWSPTDAISIPLIWQGTHNYPSHEEALILQSLNSYLGDVRIEKYLQNAPYDTTVIARELGINVQGIILDTMYSHHLLYPELLKSLDFQCSIHTDFPMYWGDKHNSDYANADYGCYDCCTTFISAQAQLKELKERGLLDFYNNQVHPVIFALTRIQNRGILIDLEAREVVREETEAQFDEASKRLYEAIGYEVNINSPKQIKELVYEKLDLPIQRKPGKERKVTTDDPALQSLARKFPKHADILKDILCCRRTRKLVSSYIDTKLINNRAHTSYGLTVTGRINSSKTIEGLGGNLQNIPRGKFRRLYIPDKGKVLIKADLSQAEYMVFVWDAPVPELIHEYTTNPNFDVHRLNASQIYSIREDEVTKEQRYNSKQTVYAGNYKVGYVKISRMHDIPLKEAKFILDRYRKIRPELVAWWARIEDEVQTTRLLTNPLGRQRMFFDRMDEALYRKAIDWKCQSTVADIINQAVRDLDENPIVDVLLQVHDELVCQCNNERVDDAARAVANAMEVRVTFPGTEIPLTIPVEIAIGPNWHDVTLWKGS